MVDLNEVAKDPRYDQAATGASKTTILVFVATFLYLVFFSGVTPGLLGGFLFFAIGIFVASILISMPLFLLKMKFPISTPIVSIAEVVITIVLTRAIYLWLFSAQVPASIQVPVESFEPRYFTCEEPLPEFTLRRTADPTDAELGDLCACIYNSLDKKNIELSKSFIEERKPDVTQEDIRVFTQHFGAAIKQCGGEDF